MSLIVYGIPSCGTVKKARAFLDKQKLAHTFVDFRATPPSKKQVEAWVARFGAKAMKNTSGGSYRALPDDKDTWSDAEWTKRFLEDPMLIKRPVIERGGQPVLVGFKGDEKVLLQTLG
jgi:arsenate reductase